APVRRGRRRGRVRLRLAAACLLGAAAAAGCGPRRAAPADAARGEAASKRTETDRSRPPAPEEAREQARPTLEGGAYGHRCPLAGLESGRLRIAPGGVITLVDGARTVATVRAGGDLYRPDVEVTCAKHFVDLRVQHDGGATYEEVILDWAQGRLAVG